MTECDNYETELAIEINTDCAGYNSDSYVDALKSNSDRASKYFKIDKDNNLISNYSPVELELEKLNSITK